MSTRVRNAVADGCAQRAGRHGEHLHIVHRWLHGVVLLLCLCAVPASAEVVFNLAGDDLDSRLEDNLRAHVSLTQADCETPRWRVRALSNQAREDALPGLRALGYYRPEIRSKLEFDDDCWRATIDIDAGRRIHIRERNVSVLGPAVEDPALQTLLAELPQGPGSALDHGEYEDIKRRLRAFALGYGYLQAAFERQELRVFPAEGLADIDLVFRSGPRYRFGDVRFGPSPLDEDFVRRLAALSSGADYAANDLIQLDRNLSDAGYFRSVEVRPLRNEAEDGVVPIDVRMEALPRHAWRSGVGYSTDTKWRFRIGYENRYLNPQGHRFDSELQLGPVESGLRLDYMIPGYDPHRDHFSFGARLAREDTTSTDSDSATLIARHVVKERGWTQTRFVELLYEESTFGSDVTRNTLVMPGLGLNRSFRDDPLRPSQGYRVDLEIRGAHDSLLSTATLAQLRGNLRGVQRLGSAGRALGRVTFGTTAGDSVTELPASLRFFAGGDNSVRGYAYKRLGPLDEDGEPTGGRHLLTGSLEYEHAVVGDDWWVAAFVDGGNAFDNDGYNPKFGYGGGVRWYSPVGRVRLDFAIPEDKREDEWRLHFGVGLDL